MQLGCDAPMTLLLYILIGAAAGYFTCWAIETKTGHPVAISMCALGGLVFHVVIPLPALVIGSVGALLGAMLLIWAFSMAID